MNAQDTAQRLIVVRQVGAADPPHDWIVAVDLGPEHPLLRLVVEPGERQTCEAEAEVFRAAVAGWIRHLQSVRSSSAEIAVWLIATVLIGEPTAPVDRLRRWQLQLKFHADAGPVLMETPYLDDLGGSAVTKVAWIARKRIEILLEQAQPAAEALAA